MTFSHMPLVPSRRGFTLIEMLLVIGILAVLASIIVVAINPTKQLANARDAQRRADINTVLNALYQYLIDGNPLPAGIPTTVPRTICKETAVSCNNGVNLSVLTTNSIYITQLPTDPSTLTGTGTNYTIVQDAQGRITIAAPGAEYITGLSVTRESNPPRSVAEIHESPLRVRDGLLGNS